MTDREKLVELVKDICNTVVKACGCSDMLPTYSFNKRAVYDKIADHLIANGVTVRKWISVKDRLPENRQQVLVYDGGATQWKASVHAAGFVKGRTKAEIMEEYERTGMLYYTFGDEESNNKKPYAWRGDAHMQWFGQQITHWMPLPEAPKEE